VIALAGFLAPLVGGVLIGLAVAALLLLGGRVAGISGILAGVVQRTPDEWAWRALFLAGLLAGGVLARAVDPGVIGPMVASPWVLVVAGVLVGYGTRLAGGCTSGHGVCGVSRGAKRSIAATATFMAVAALVVLLVRHGVRG
jgi:uncharacterized membrane protein YedE/YeeE